MWVLIICSIPSYSPYLAYRLTIHILVNEDSSTGVMHEEALIPLEYVLCDLLLCYLFLILCFIDDALSFRITIVFILPSNGIYYYWLMWFYFSGLSLSVQSHLMVCYVSLMLFSSLNGSYMLFKWCCFCLCDRNMIACTVPSTVPL